MLSGDKLLSYAAKCYVIYAKFWEKKALTDCFNKATANVKGKVALMHLLVEG